MKYIMDSDSVDFVWSALNKPANPPYRSVAENIMRRIAARGWAFNSDMEDLVDSLDNRLSSHEFDMLKFADYLGIRLETICFRPSVKANSVSEYDGFRAEEAALYLIMLERMGFQTDPGELVTLLLPAIKSKKKLILSNAELELFWFDKTRHKHAGISLISDGKKEYAESAVLMKTMNGYVIQLKTDDSGTCKAVEISAPKFRKRKDPQRIICSDCGTEWYRGDAASSYKHRQEHKVIMAYMNPIPLQKFLEDRSSSTDPELVKAGSSEWRHAEMYIRARAFRREFGYDFIQWGGTKGIDDVNVNGFLFGNEEGAIVGACSFRKRTPEGSEPAWALQWVWICPKERRNGHLGARWAMFRQRFGNFVVESPVSDAMKGFLAKKGDTALLNFPLSNSDRNSNPHLKSI